jgi:hypothetical protein
VFLITENYSPYLSRRHKEAGSREKVLLYEDSKSKNSLIASAEREKSIKLKHIEFIINLNFILGFLLTMHVNIWKEKSIINIFA